MKPPRFDLAGKVAIVTGASRGLGEGMARALAEVGAAVVLASRDVQALEQVAKTIEAQGGKSLPLGVDLTHLRDIEPMIQRTLDTFGRIDILVNNAGTTVRKPAIEFTEEDWDLVLQVNLKAAFFCSIVAGRVMMQQGGGKIINTASLTSQIGIPNIAAYAASKSGIMGITRTLAVEWAKYRINVNAIAPGYFLTELTAPLFADPERRAWIMGRIPMRRHGTPEDLGGTVVFLASEASDYITGQLFFVDGGWTAS